MKTCERLSRMLMLTFSWNFDFGRKFKEANKKLWNSDEDSGILCGDPQIKKPVLITGFFCFVFWRGN